MTLAADLAELALAPVAPEAADHLRALTLTNVAAAAGDHGRVGELIEALPLDGDEPAGSAFLDGMRLHARTQDDFYPHGRVHVGAVTLAVTLALADRARRPLLDSLAAGYEVMCAVSYVYGRDAQARGYRPTGVFGPMGGAAAAAHALGFDRDGVATAIALAAARSSGTNQSWVAGTDEWLLEVGSAARAGVEAALFTEAGAAAAPDALEGAAGWARAYFGDEAASRLAEAMSSPAARTREVAQKPYPVSGIAQVPTRLGCDAHELVGESTPDAVLVRIPAVEAVYPGSANRGPFRSRSAALMSVSFCVACGLADGVVRLERLERPNELGPLVERVRVEGDEALGESEAVLELTVGGERHTVARDAADVLYPRWGELSSDGGALARRSEADAELVAAARDELRSPYPDARTLHRLLRRGR